MILSIDKKKPQPVFEQLVSQIKNLIESGTLNEGFQMPATRQMADMVGVNRSTVIRAYEELWAMGFFESTPGSYTRVRKRKSIIQEQVNINSAENIGEVIFNEFKLHDSKKLDKFSHLISNSDKGIISFQRLEPDSRLIERKLISNCYRKALADLDLNVFGYCHPRGLKPLREVLLDHMKLHSINANVENILITNGSQNSLQLIFQAYIKKNDVIAIESPSYSMLVPLIRQFDPRVLEIPVQEDGMDISVLQQYLDQYPVKLVYSVPSFQNPTGVTLSQQKREKLLSLCEQHKVLIIEDSIEEEMKYFGKIHLPIKSMDTHQIVIYLGSFSKILAPGFRTGWIIAHNQCINHLTSLKTIFDLSSNTFTQAILYQFCKSGYYELHIRKLLRVFKKRMKITLAALKKYIPPERASWSEPLGGFLIWIKLNISDEKPDLEAYFLNYGVKVSEGNSFFYSPQKSQFIRISIAQCNEEEIVEGIKRIALAIKNLPE